MPPFRSGAFPLASPAPSSATSRPVGCLREEQSWLRDLHGKSVTELEILHGVLNNPDMAGRASFYCRDPQFVETVPADRKSDFTAEDAAMGVREVADEMPVLRPQRTGRRQQGGRHVDGVRGWYDSLAFLAG